MHKLHKAQDKTCVYILNILQQSEIVRKLYKPIFKENIYMCIKYKSILKLQH